jgi:hypothetical protein
MDEHWDTPYDDDISELVPRHSDFDVLNPNITATLAGVSDRRGLRYCEQRPASA